MKPKIDSVNFRGMNTAKDLDELVHHYDTWAPNYDQVSHWRAHLRTKKFSVSYDFKANFQNCMYVCALLECWRPLSAEFSGSAHEWHNVTHNCCKLLLYDLKSFFQMLFYINGTKFRRL